MQSVDAGEASARDARVQDAAFDADAPAAAGGAEVVTSLGRLAGKVVGQTRVFQGIPYAQPPMGALRFALPVPALAWSGTRSAKEAGPVCPQLDQPSVDGRTGTPLIESEDCLSLDIYAPSRVPAAGAPVMVFIHGGGGNTGANSLYDGTHLSEAGDVVVVTLNYRLGTLAWAVHPELDAELGTTSGNLGLRDQQLALRWVEEHIAAFGGDPSRITLFGQSHGAFCTCMHMFARGSEELADRYILHSGACVATAVGPATREGMEQRTRAVLDELCAGRADPIPCLREQDAKRLATLGVPGLPLTDAQGVYVDGTLIEETPRRLLEQGRYHHAPMLLGSTLHENDFLASEHFHAASGWPLIADPISLLITLSAMYPSDWTSILAFYSARFPMADSNELMLRIMDDGWGRCSSRVLAKNAAQAGDHVYVYSFELLPAVHIQDLDYVFGLELPYSKLFEGAPVPLVSSVVDAVQGYWTRFAHAGDPNGAGALAWPKFTPDSERHIVFDRELRTGQRHLASECDFWASTVAGSH